MPNYNYECKNCGYVEERFGVFSSMPKKTDCPKCLHGNTFIRCIGTGLGVIFKGTGFYETDVKKKRDAIKEGKDMKKMREEKRKAGEG